MAFIKDSDITVLKPLVDAMIPRCGEMPSATEAGILPDLMEKVLDLSEDLRKPYRNAIRFLEERIGEDPLEAFEALRNSSLDDYKALGFIVPAAYCMVQEVRDKIGYDGQVGLDVETELMPDCIMNGLLEPVILRGKSYIAV